jgi:hypothetical protein
MASNRDEEILHELRRLAGEVDPVPGEVTSFAKAALGWRRIDAELAELLSDSLLDSGRVALTRGAAGTRALSFKAADLEIDLEIRESEPGFLLLGQLAPPVSATIDVERDDGSVTATVEADELGRFRTELESGGRLRLRIRRESAPDVETSWIAI